MNLSRKSKIIITMILVAGVLAAVLNLIHMGCTLWNQGEQPDVKIFLKIAVGVLWIVFFLAFFIYKERKSALFLDLEDIYNNNFGPIGKIKLMKKVIKEHHYAEEMLKLEKKEYGISLKGCTESEKILALRAEIESANIFETIFSLIGVILAAVLNSIDCNKENNFIYSVLMVLILLILMLWMTSYIKNMKRNRFILTVVESYDVKSDKK